jgi:hypothetical protein
MEKIKSGEITRRKMQVYMVVETDEGLLENILAVYDEETFKKEYKNYNKYTYEGKTWDACTDVYLWEVNGDYKSITVQDVEKLISEEMSSM